MAWIPKGSIRTHTGDDQVKGATQLKEEKDMRGSLQN
jgi:hypothetical protein